MSDRLALIIANSEFDDPKLAQLVTPSHDAKTLANVLGDPTIGNFDVTLLVNRTLREVRAQIGRLYRRKKRDDLLLLFYSGHGIKDDYGDLYLAVRDTEAEVASATAIDAAFVSDQLDKSSSQRKVVMLDCCYSGAFTRGRKALGSSVGTREALAGNGYGRVILTASNAIEYAWEGDEPLGESARSVFTHFLVEGLQTGAADLDGDGQISLNELYNYVYERVITSGPSKQTPQRWAEKVEGQIIIAHSPVTPSLVKAERTELHKKRLRELYDQLQEAVKGQDWATAEAQCWEIMSLEPGYQDVPELWVQVREAQARQRELEKLYQETQSRLESRAWAEAKDLGQRIEALEPGYRDVGELLGRAEEGLRQEQARQQAERLKKLYEQMQDAIEGQDWETAEARCLEILAYDQEYEDVPELWMQVRGARGRQERVEDLYQEAQAKVRGGAWKEAKDLCQRIEALDSGYRNVSELLRKAEEGLRQERAEQERQAQLARLYERARVALQGKRWEEAKQSCADIEALEPGYRHVDQLQREAEEGLRQRKLQKERDAQLARLYDQLQAAAAQEDWTKVQTLGRQIQGLAPGYRDVAQWMARARKELGHPQRAPMPNWAWALVGVLVLGLVGGIGWAMTHPRQTPTPTPPRVVVETRPSAEPVVTPTPELITHVPTLAPPVRDGTAVPQPSVVISAQNVNQVELLARWGKGSVRQVAYAPDGTLIAVASSVGIYLYDAETLAEARFIETDTHVRSVDFSPDGRMLASASDAVVHLWRVSDGTLVRTLEGHKEGVVSVAFSPGGETLASGSSDKTVRLWQVSDGQLLRTLEGHTESVSSVAFSPDGETLASGGSWSDETVRLWRTEDGALLYTLEGHTDPVESVTFSPDGAIVASGSRDNTVRLWRTSDGSLLRTLEGHTYYVFSVEFSPDGAILASGACDNTVRLWQVSDGSLLRTLEGHTYNVYSVAFSPDGETLASASMQDGTVRLWRISDGRRLRAVEDHTFQVNDVTFSPDGAVLVWASFGKVYLRWVSDGTLFSTLEWEMIHIGSADISADRETVATGSQDNVVRLWRISDGTLLHKLSGHTGTVGRVVFSPDGTKLASGALDNTVRLWRVSDGKLLHILEGQEHYYGGVAFSPDGETLASGAGDYTVRLWRVSDGALLRTLAAHTSWVRSVAFSPDGEILASGARDSTVRLWRVSDGRLLHTFEGGTGDVNGIAFSPDGTVLASATEDALQLWHVSDGTLLRTFEGYAGHIDFSPDGTKLATGWVDSVRLWGVLED